jgi:hypothetical protein
MVTLEKESYSLQPSARGLCGVVGGMVWFGMVWFTQDSPEHDGTFDPKHHLHRIYDAPLRSFYTK